MTDRKPWDRLPGEGTRAYEAFLRYRDMPPGRRSIQRVSVECAKSTPLLKRWSARHDWVARALAWDEEGVRQADETHIELRRTALERHGALARETLAQVAQYLAPPETDPDTGRPLSEEAKEEWRLPLDALRVVHPVLKVAVLVERLSLGLPTAITQDTREVEQAVQDALEAQRQLVAVVRNYLDGGCDCGPCRATHERLVQLAKHQRRAKANTDW